MFYKLMIAAAATAVLIVSPMAFAQGQFGTADDAKAMLMKAATAMKANKTKTLDLINKGEGGFLDRDIYPFCFDLSDGKILAVASNNAKQFLGTDIRAIKDATGKIYGPDLHAAAQKPEGQVTEVSYMFPRPGADKTPVQKVSFVTKVGDLGCGVGFYK
jgi:Single Cache domain 2